MSVTKINFKIVTPEKTVYESGIDQATLPVLDGQITILPGHRSYIAALKPGEIMVKVDAKEVLMATSGGFIEFQNNTLIVLADTAEHAEEIDVARAEQARLRAEEIKQEKGNMDEMEYAKVAAAIEKESVRIRIGKKHHTSRGIKLD